MASDLEIVIRDEIESAIEAGADRATEEHLARLILAADPERAADVEWREAYRRGWRRGHEQSIARVNRLAEKLPPALALEILCR